MVFLGTIREILGGCVEEGQFLVFVAGLFFWDPFKVGDCG